RKHVPGRRGLARPRERADLDLTGPAEQVDGFAPLDDVARREERADLRAAGMAVNAIAPTVELFHGVARDVETMTAHEIGHGIVIPPGDDDVIAAHRSIWVAEPIPGSGTADGPGRARRVARR